MKTIEIAFPRDELYQAAGDFAARVYREKLGFTLTELPELVFVVHENAEVFGCMGLNTKVSSALFLKDPRVALHMSLYDKRNAWAEQNVLAVERCMIGVPLLVAVVADYAYTIGIETIVYAAIDVSKKTIAHLGFDVYEYGPVDLAALPPG